MSALPQPENSRLSTTVPPSRKSSARPDSPPSHRIAFSNGFWWYFHPAKPELIRLDPLFQRSGWRVENLARCLGVGKRTFCRAVANSLGLTAKFWLRQIRIVVARHMLREGRKTAEIASMLGIGAEADFAREFKKLVGVTPSFFRQSEYLRSIGYVQQPATVEVCHIFPSENG
jgi:AraC-like DNA-binding protein